MSCSTIHVVCFRRAPASVPWEQRKYVTYVNVVSVNQVRRLEPPQSSASSDEAEEAPSAPKEKPKKRSWLDVSSPVRGAGRRGRRRRRRGRSRSPNGEDPAEDPVEQEIEEYFRAKWNPTPERETWTAGDWWMTYKTQYPRIERLARILLATQVIGPNEDAFIVLCAEYRLP